jgi:CubicO group peptidase (beta-lactamase class C family)
MAQFCAAGIEAIQIKSMRFSSLSFGFLIVLSSAVAHAQVNFAALSALIEGAQKSNSSALVVMQEDRILYESTFGQPTRKIETMSVTKSVVSMIVGTLIDSGKIKSVDEPIHTFFPEWKQGRKKAITLKHLLNHTSGLQADSHTAEIYASPDFVQLALAAELADEPGARFFYNNKAVNLIAGVVKKASGKRMDEYAREVIFGPLDITDFNWSLDRAGNPHGQSGLQLHARDLAKLGFVMANDGVWSGKRILSQKWIDMSTTQSSPQADAAGLLWWRVFESEALVVDAAMVEKVRAAGADASFIAKVSQFVGRYESSEAVNTAVQKIFGDNAAYRETLNALKIPRLTRAEVGQQIGFNGNGWRGQYLYVFPAKKLVIVRLIESSERHNDAGDNFAAFGTLATNIAKAGWP